MKPKFAWSVLARGALLAGAAGLLSGCALFGVKPMPERLSGEEQQKREYAWRHLVTLGPEVERVALLDVMLIGQAWHSGVDRLYLRSEKQVGDVLVTMETQFERTTPEQDVFTITFHDAQGRILRQERFTSAEFDEAFALYQTPEGEIEDEAPADREQRLARLAERDARWERAEEVFPAPPESDATAEETEADEAEADAESENAEPDVGSD